MKKFTITVAGAELATVLAALRFYQQSGMADPANRSDAIHDIATDYERIVSLDSDAIGSLIEKLDPNELSRSLQPLS